MIKLEKVKIKYKKRVVLDINELYFKSNGLYCIVGANGSGKTTLLKAIANIIPYDGNIYIDNKNTKDIGDDLFNKICYLDQFGNLLDFLSVNNNYNYINHFLNDSINVEENKNPINLSGGQRKKYEEKRINYSNYDIFLLDEPSTSLDKEHKRKLIDKIKDLSKDKLLIIVSHDEDIIDISDYIYKIDELNSIKSEFEDKNVEYNSNLINNDIPNINKILSSRRITYRLMTFIFSLFVISLCIFLSSFSFRYVDLEKEMGEKCGWVEFRTQESDDIRDAIKNDTLLTNYFICFSPYEDFDVFDAYSDGFTKYSSPKIIYEYKGESVQISDFTSYVIFKDFKDHTGETFDYINEHDEVITFTIDKTINTFFSKDFFNNNRTETAIDFYKYDLFYIIIPYEYCTKTDAGVLKYASVDMNIIPKNHYCSMSIEKYFELQKTMDNLSIVFGMLSFLFGIIYIYYCISLIFMNKGKISILYKLWTLGASKKVIKQVYNRPYIKMSVIVFILSFFILIFEHILNKIYEAEVYKNIGMIFVKSSYYIPFVILLIEVFGYFIRNIYLKRKLLVK